MVSIGRKLLQAAAPPPQPQLIASLNASQCWDLNFTMYLASDMGTNPTTVPALGYTTMNALDVMSADQGLQVCHCGAAAGSSFCNATCRARVWSLQLRR